MSINYGPPLGKISRLVDTNGAHKFVKLIFILPFFPSDFFSIYSTSFNINYKHLPSTFFLAPDLLTYSTSNCAGFRKFVSSGCWTFNQSHYRFNFIGPILFQSYKEQSLCNTHHHHKSYLLIRGYEIS